jgi:broad specificity phosphatase PhoE
MILLVRHARAGRRGSAGPDDSLRPLDEKGVRQASALVALLGQRRIGSILSSPYRRCVETVEPLAAAAGLEVELRDELAEGAPGSQVLPLIAGAGEGDIVLCTHGDVIGELIGHGRPAKKGSVWVLDPEHDLQPGEYLLPE